MRFSFFVRRAFFGLGSLQHHHKHFRKRFFWNSFSFAKGNEILWDYYIYIPIFVNCPRPSEIFFNHLRHLLFSNIQNIVRSFISKTLPPLRRRIYSFFENFDFEYIFLMEIFLQSIFSKTSLREEGVFFLIFATNSNRFGLFCGIILQWIWFYFQTFRNEESQKCRWCLGFMLGPWYYKLFLQFWTFGTN